jgi:hypothetical protein
MEQGSGTGRRTRWLALLSGVLAWVPLVAAVALSGCGAPAAPQPPTLNLPQPVRTLSADRVSDTVRVSFAVPEKTTDRLPIRGAMTARLCRSLGNAPSTAGSCQPVATMPLNPQQKAATIEDHLPADLSQGTPRLLTYRVAILNRAGKAATDSPPAFAAAGAAPSSVSGFAVTPRRRGIVLHWQPAYLPAGSTTWVDFHRTRTSAKPVALPAKSPGTPPPQDPAEQNLQVQETGGEQSEGKQPEGEQRGIALDATAHVGNSYRYTAQRVAEVSIAGHPLKISGATDASAAIDYRDIFPPPVPTGLLSAVDTPSHAIDLSWSPISDPGLAGYIVYRRAPGSGTPERLTLPGKSSPVPAWRDTNISPGERYAYSVSAIDTSGNESARSAEVEDGIAATHP